LNSLQSTREGRDKVGIRSRGGKAINQTSSEAREGDVAKKGGTEVRAKKRWSTSRDVDKT